MAKSGLVLNEAFVEALGFSQQLMTLTRAITNQPHQSLHEPMFHIHTEENQEIIYLERQYLYDHLLNIKPDYATGEKVLLWTYYAQRYRNGDENEKPVMVLFASDIFLMHDPREYLRFRAFLKSKRVFDGQARDYLSKNHELFPRLAESSEGIELILNCLARINDWPDPENGFKKRSGGEHTQDGVAKEFSIAIIAARNSPLLPGALLKRKPDERINAFKIMCYAEDPALGPSGLLTFLRAMGAATNDQGVIEKTGSANAKGELSKSLEILKRFLVSNKTSEA